MHSKMKLSQFCRIKWERARDFRKKGHYQEAEKELKEALDEDPENFLLRMSLAELYLRQDRLSEARILAEAVLSVSPQYPQALYVLGGIFYKENNFGEALQYFRHAAEKDNRPYLILRIAKTLREMENYKEALETLDTVLVSDRESLLFLKEKALILNRIKQCDEALGIYEKVKKLDPNDSFVRKEIYRLKGLKRPEEKTIQELKTILNLPSKMDDSQLHGLLGQKLKDTGKLKEAASEFHRAAQLEPNNPYFLKQEGFCYYNLGDYQEAINLLGQVFRKDPNDFRIRVTLEKMYSTTNNLLGFMDFLEDILADYPHNVKLMGTLKKIHKQVRANES